MVSILRAVTLTTLQQALLGAPEKPAVEVARSEQELFVFRAGTMAFGIRAGNVREVVRLGDLTPVPRSAGFVLGVFGHRGEVLPVIDVLRFFGRGEVAAPRRSRAFVAVSGDWSAAVVVDGVIGFVKILSADILPPPVGGEVPVEYLVGVVRAKETSGSVAVLHLPQLLSGARHRIVTR